MNTALTEHTAIYQLEESVFLIVLNATNGDKIISKEFQYPSLTFTSGFQIYASGKISDTKVVIGSHDNSFHLLTFVDVVTWVANTFYVAHSGITTQSFVPLFSTDQIILMYQGVNSEYYTLQTAYDKLNLTEMYTT